MAIGKIFKKTEEKKEKPLKTEKKATVVKSESIAWRVLEGPYVSEKSTDLMTKDKYLFKVSSVSNKDEVKRAIEDLYKVDVIAVKVINVPGKAKRLGKHKGRKKGFKKAIIEIKKGQQIDIIPN